VDAGPRLRWLLPVIGLPLCLIAGILADRQVVLAWEACDDMSAGGSFGLTYVFLPGVILVSWVAFAVGTLVASQIHIAIRVVIGLALVVVICVAAVEMWVPAYPASDYQPGGWHANYPGYPECGSDGIPSWWPSWLPS
jgi:hypothetical protein